MTESPAAESSATLRWMSAFAPTSMPRVGSSRMSSSGAVASQRARSTFCWLPPDRLPTTASGFGRPHAECLDVLGDHGVPLGLADLAHPAAPGLDAQDDVLGDREVGDDALAASVLGGERDPVLDGVARSADLRGLAVDSRSIRCRRDRRRRAGGRARCGPSPAGRRGRRPRRRRRRGRPARAPRGGPRRWPGGPARRSGRSSRLEAAEIASRSSSSRPIILVTRSSRGRSSIRYSPTSWPLRSTVMRSEIS